MEWMQQKEAVFRHPCQNTVRRGENPRRLSWPPCLAQAPEERPALVAKLCKPKDEKRAGRKEKKAIVRAKAEKLETEASEPCEPAELPSAPSPELAPQPVKIDNQQLLEIAASRYHVKRRATGSDMLCEIEAAADNLKQRWEHAFQYYPDLLIDRGQSDRSRHDCPKPDKLLKRSGGNVPYEILLLSL